MFFSVIIPAFNAEGVILRCLDSLDNQSFKDFEVIIINDGSTDNTEKILQEYINKRKNFSFVTKENGGVSIARNIGIGLAKGNYLVFLDSDDWVESDYLLYAHDKIKKNNLDGLIFNYYESFETNVRLMNNNVKNCKCHNLEELFLRGVIKGNPWDKIFRKALYERRNIRFPESISIGEDACVVHMLLQNADNVMFSDRAFLHYQLDTCGVTKTKISKKKIHDVLWVSNYIENNTSNINKYHTYYYSFRLLIDYYFNAYKDKACDIKMIEKKLSQSVSRSSVKSPTSKKQLCILILFKIFSKIDCIRILSNFRK
ncbi:glycosyltransferase family 2 protein [Vibrio parahaemolyticus]|nr:glycosyltransferase family 2 protein [Vibrio parahaemolyticus]